MLDTWLQDARFALRLLRKSPLFTATAALSLAIGIGANATIFSAASAMLLRPMPGLANPERLVDVGRVTRGYGFDTVSYPNYVDLRDRTTSFTGIYAYELEPTPMSLGRRRRRRRRRRTRLRRGRHRQLFLGARHACASRPAAPPRRRQARSAPMRWSSSVITSGSGALPRIPRSSAEPSRSTGSPSASWVWRTCASRGPRCSRVTCGFRSDADAGDAQPGRLSSSPGDRRGCSWARG